MNINRMQNGVCVYHILVVWGKPYFILSHEVMGLGEWERVCISIRRMINGD